MIADGAEEIQEQCKKNQDSIYEKENEIER